MLCADMLKPASGPWQCGARSLGLAAVHMLMRGRKARTRRWGVLPTSSPPASASTTALLEMWARILHRCIGAVVLGMYMVSCSCMQQERQAYGSCVSKTG